MTLVPRPSFESIYLNLERPQFKELAVREALYAAIDKGAIIEALYYGVPTATETFMPQQSFYYNPNLPVQEFNLSVRARSSIRPAGCPGGMDPCQERGASVLLQLDHLGDHLREQVQQFLQQAFAQIGVEMTIKNLPAAVIWGEFWGKSQFDSVIVGSTT